MKLAVVVQRYGADVNGGAELHARYVAEHLAKHAEVEVLTTCAKDYIFWSNEFDPGESRVGNLLVRRFPVKRPRDLENFDQWSTRVFEHRHSVAHELAWLDSEGPTSPKLIGDTVVATISACSSATATTTPTMDVARSLLTRFLYQQPSVIPQLVCQSSGRFFGASAASCTTRSKNVR